jgi:hypothetical protein
MEIVTTETYVVATARVSPGAEPVDNVAMRRTGPPSGL